MSRSVGAAVWQRRWTIGLAATLIAGVVFRLIWLSDIEYKGDEVWTVAAVREFSATHAWPWVGMESSAFISNAGMSLWVFLGIGAVSGADPLALARAVQLMNTAAIVLLAGFAITAVAREEREPWLWSTALVAVNPLAVLFQRKIWPPSTLPLFTLAFLVCWWHRQRRWGAFFWGLLGVVLGQIQLAGFFFSAGFILCALLFSRRSVRWGAWLAGTLIGILPALPWIMTMAARTPRAASLGNLGPYFVTGWANIALGLDLHYPLGENLAEFAATPVLAGRSTYLAAALLGACALIGVIVAVRAITGTRDAATNPLKRLFSTRTETDRVIMSSFWLFGALMTASLRPFILHYLVVAFSLPGLSIAYMARAGNRTTPRSVATGRLLLTILVLAQMTVTALFLDFVHHADRIEGDYGTPYRAQSHSGN